MKARRKMVAGSSGAALALVLWAVFVLTTLLIVVVRLVHFDLDLGEQGSKRFSARQVAQTGVGYALHPKVKRGDALLTQTYASSDRLEVRISNEDARLNINGLLLGDKTASLQRLFVFWGVKEKDAAMAVDSLKDWVDEDDQRSLNGAEAGDTSGFSVPENRPFLSVGEMENVRGMEAVRRAKPEWAEFFSTKSSGRLDLQDVSGDLLQVFGGLGADQARAFVQFRAGADGKAGTADDPEIMSVQTLGSVAGLSPEQVQNLEQVFGTGSLMRRVVSDGYSGGLRHEITVIATAGKPGYLSWAEER